MVHFIGAGPGAEDLITIRGAKLLSEADVVIYAGSLINTKILNRTKPSAKLFDSAKMTLEEVTNQTKLAISQNKMVVRLHSGDPCLYGAIKEQMDLLDNLGIQYAYTPGVSCFSGAASALKAEYTLPGVSQSVIITRIAGKTPVPPKESISSFAAHDATMVIFLSTGLLKDLEKELIKGGYSKDDPAAIVYKATWEDEKIVKCTVSTLVESAEREGITKTALIIVGKFLNGIYDRSLLYHPEFSTEYREAANIAKDDKKLAPMQIEQKSFEIIGKELKELYPNLHLSSEQEMILKRVIHTSADFSFADNIHFPVEVCQAAVSAIKSGARIITDTNMAKSGINKKAAAKFGIEIDCFVADEDLAEKSKSTGLTRSALAVKKAAKLYGNEDRQLIFVVGNAPTALLALDEAISSGVIKPALIVAAPVGFVNVVESKEIILRSGIPCIATMGRRGGSNIAAAIINAIMYMAGGRNEK